jgi:hypothetical protein
VRSRISIMILLVVALGLWSVGKASTTTAGFDNNQPNSVVLDSVDAVAGWGQVEVRWTTVSELDTAGFYVMRSTSEDGTFEQANDDLILATGDGLSGDSYSFVDKDVAGGTTYYYYIRELPNSGPPNDYTGEWIRHATPKAIFLPFIAKQ